MRRVPCPSSRFHNRCGVRVGRVWSARIFLVESRACDVFARTVAFRWSGTVPAARR